MKSVVKDIPKGYKESVLGVIPDDWSIVRLKDKFDRITTKNKKGLTNVLTISAQHGLINQEEYFNKSVASKNLSNYTVLEKGDFAYNKSYSTGYPYGAIKKLKKYDEGVVSPLYICFRPSKNNKSPDFYEQYFEAGMLNREIHAIAQEGARNHGLLNISIGDFFNTFIIDADEKELNKIAEILNTWDKAIELKEKLIEQKKELKKGLMQKLLTGEVRLPGFDGEWKNEKIKNISNVFRGASPRPISDPKWFDEQSEIGWVRISDVTKSNKVLHQTEQYLSDEGVKKSRLVKKNSIIMSICATVGKPVITGFDVCIHDGFVVFEDVQINKDYFYFALLRKENHWEKYGQTGSQMNLNTDIVGSEKILFPGDPFEQQAIANILITADREINLLESELEFIRNQKKGLMQLLLTGKVRVQV